MDVEEEDTQSSGEFGLTKPSPMKRSRSGVGEGPSEEHSFADTMPNPYAATSTLTRNLGLREPLKCAAVKPCRRPGARVVGGHRRSRTLGSLSYGELGVPRPTPTDAVTRCWCWRFAP